MGIFDQHIVQEVYFGETKGIQEIYEELSGLRHKYMNLNKVDIKKVNKDPIIIKINRLVEKEFGFGTFELVIEGQGINAFTYPISTYKKDKWDLPEKIKGNKKGIKYKNTDYNTLVYITPELFFDSRFTDREIMGILLHEIGHNFNVAIYTSGVDLLKYGLKVTNIIESNISEEIKKESDIKKIIINISSNNKNNPIVANIKKIILEGFGESINLLDLFLLPISRLINNLSNMIISTLFPKQRMLRKLYNDEILSDSFATMYGYGPDLMTGIDKIETYSYETWYTKTTQSIPLVFQLINLQTVAIDIITHGFNVHPNNAARLHQQIYLLRTELAKDNLDPKMRKEIENNLNEIEDLLIKYKKENFKVDNPLLFQKLYQATMYSICGGDIREIMIKDNIPEKIDNIYKK